MKLFDNALTVLERALDVRLERQSQLASNAANLDTPDYKERDVDFQAAMRAVLSGGDGGRSAVEGAVASATHEREDAPEGLDGNSVDLDRTMVALAENGLQYGAAAKAAGKKLAILKYVASDGNA